MVSRKFGKLGLKTKYVGLILMVWAFCMLLAACGDVTATQPGGPAVSSTPAHTTVVAPTLAATNTVVATTAAGTTAIANTVAGTAPATPAISTAPASEDRSGQAAVYQPEISFSSARVAVGGFIMVTGKGYPANTKLAVQLGPQGGKIAPDSGTLTDNGGKFSCKVYFVTYPDGSVVRPGNSVLAVGTEDGVVKASAVVTVVASPAAGNRTGPAKLIQDFFNTYKSDSKAALAFLGADLQAKIRQGQTTLPQLLGVQNAPVSVEISLAVGTANTYNVYENFEKGRQYIQMDVAGDKEGSLKILAVRIPNPPPPPAGSGDRAGQSTGY
jgi:hypothetical protein